MTAQWKTPPVLKVLEALGALADCRVVESGPGQATVASSDGSKHYAVSWDEKERIVSSNDNASVWQGAMFWVIPTKSENPELAWDFIEYTTFAYEDDFMQESMDREFVLPAYTKFMDVDYFWKDAEEFYGANLRQKAHELAQGAPVNYLPPEYTESETIMLNEMLKMVNDEQTPQQTRGSA